MHSNATSVMALSNYINMNMKIFSDFVYTCKLSLVQTHAHMMAWSLRAFGALNKNCWLKDHCNAIFIVISILTLYFVRKPFCKSVFARQHIFITSACQEITQLFESHNLCLTELKKPFFFSEFAVAIQKTIKKFAMNSRWYVLKNKM